jgi:hypothetical protein
VPQPLLDVLGWLDRSVPGWLPIALWGLGAAAVLAHALSAWAAGRRASSGAGRITVTTPPSPADSSAVLPGRTGPAPPEPGVGVAALTGALHEVAERAPGAAIREQITRLFQGSPHRSDLVDAAIGYRDQLRVRDHELVEVLRAALVQANVHELPTKGESFDPSRHIAVDNVHTHDRALDDRIAYAHKPGYRDGGRVLRLPEVVVYRNEPADRNVPADREEDR